jgi:hypothetical protein
MMDFVFFAALSLVLGFKHAFDADHLVAVSSFFTRRRGYGAGVGLATAWAAGHLVTAAAISAVLYFFAGTFLPQLVGLLALGFEARRFHVHRHRHQDAGPEHAHPHVHVRGATRHEHGAIAGIGVIHGLASNDELLVVLLVGLGASAWWQVFAGIALFSVGVLVGMIVYAAAVRLVEERFPGRATATALNVTFSVLSIGYGIYLLLGGAGLNLLDRWVGFA